MEMKAALHEYIRILLRWAWLLVLTAFCAGFGSYVASSRQQPIYQASTTILIDEATSATNETDYQSILTSERRARTYAQLLSTEPLLQTVIKRLGLSTSAEELRQAIEVQSGNDTQLITVRVSANNGQHAAKIANTLVRAFADQIKQRQASRYALPKQSLEGQMARLTEQIQQTESRLTALSGTANEVVDRAGLETNLAQYRQSYTDLLQSYEQVRLAEAQTQSSIVLVEPAIAPDTPVSPGVLRIVVLAAVVQLLIVAGFVFLKESLDESVKSAEGLSQQLGLPVLGTLDRVGKLPRTRPLAAVEPRSPAAESFRALRTNLECIMANRTLHTIVITSPGPDEGKTHVAVNLATVLAQNGHQVSLLDADLRRPTLHHQLALPNHEGLSELLLRPDVSLEGKGRLTSVEGLCVITAGRLPPNPAELLGSARMSELLAQLRQQADVVVIDSPPISMVTDAAVLAHRADGVVLVVRAGRTQIAACKQALEQLRWAGADVIGVVINDMARNQSRSWYANQPAQHDPDAHAGSWASNAPGDTAGSR